MVVTVNGRKLPAIAGTKAARTYVPFSGVRCIAKDDGNGNSEGCLLTAESNMLSLQYPDDDPRESGPFSFSFSLPEQTSVLDDLILYGCRDTIMLMNKRGFVLLTLRSPQGRPAKNLSERSKEVPSARERRNG
jgi:hypothetical protein